MSKTIVITGGTDGLGLALADRLVEEGANVAICARNKLAVEATTATLGSKAYGAAVDVSGRAYLVWNVSFSAPKVGDFDTELVREFFQALAQNAGLTLHVENLAGENCHHIAETCFKAVARVLRA